MSKRARQGLGFVVVAVLLWLIALATKEVPTVQALAGIACIATGVYGLAMLAWGLIRD